AELLKLLQGAKIVPDLEILQDGVLTIDATSSDLSKVVIDQDADVDEVIIITSSESFELEAESVSGVVVGGSNLEEVKLPESVTSVEITETSSSIEIIADNVSEVVVGGANLEEVKLPESVISVEITETSSSIEIIADNVSEVVVGSSNLEEVKLPESVTSVEITETSADESFTLVLTGDESSLENVNFTSSSDADNFTLNNQTTNSVEVDIKLDGESFANLNPEAGEESLIPTETPSIATQPKDANYKLGAQAEALKVEANLIGGLGELSYQWFKDGEEISGATKATYTPSTDTEGAFEYYCVVTNLYNAETKSTSSNKAKITISSQDDDDSDEVAVKSITLSKDTLSLKVSGTETLTFTINPSNATNQNVTWTSSNEKVAKVDNNGKITAIGVGSATISITTEDGEKTDNCAVSVTSSSSGSSSSSSSGSSSGGGSSLGSANSSSSSSATTTEASIESTTIDTSTGFNEFNPDIEVEEEKDPSATLKINTSQELLSKLASATSEDEIEILKDEYYEDIIIKYSDLEEASYGAPHWGRHAVAFCLKQGYFDGIYGDKTDEEVDFGIDDFATRLEIVQVLANMVEDISEFTYNSDFVDVELDSEGSNAVAWAVSKEITNGTNQETKEFSPSANVERQEMATFFDRFITSLGVELELPEVDGSDNFTDSESIYPYAKDSISKLQNVGIIQGNNDGSFNPLSNITRAELATMVEKLVLLLAQD
ncbi:MAG: S-layer homology domain-containing protein, partial [bacterium]